jgi:hypothetical protein
LYIEEIRRKIPTAKVPTLKSTVEYVINFVRVNEDDFLKWVENNKNEGE